MVAIYETMLRNKSPSKWLSWEVTVMREPLREPSQQPSSPPIMTTHLYYVEFWQQVAVSQGELIAIQKFSLRDALIFSTGLIHFFWEGGGQVIV